jgi:hypothetical protein
VREGRHGVRERQFVLCVLFVCDDTICNCVVAEMAGGGVYGSIRRYTYVHSLVDLY